jgi:hypothetical protein
VADERRLARTEEEQRRPAERIERHELPAHRPLGHGKRLEEPRAFVAQLDAVVFYEKPLLKFERLLARPTAEMCIFCKEEAEREESSSFQGRQSKSLGKTVELSGNA